MVINVYPRRLSCGEVISAILSCIFYYLSLAMLQGLISVYLMDCGYSASQVSLVVSGFLAASVVMQPFVGNLSDRFDKRIVLGPLRISWASGDYGNKCRLL